MRIRFFCISVLIGIITLLAVQLALSPDVDADDFISVKTVSIDAKSFFPGSHNPLITDNGLPNKAMGQELNLNVDTDLATIFFWNNTIHSDTDDVINVDGSHSNGQFRLVGLETSLGIDFRQISSDIPVTFGYYHYSQHELDGVSPWHYPVEDAVQVKIFLYQRSSNTY